jgi:hypothetical protein
MLTITLNGNGIDRGRVTARSHKKRLKLCHAKLAEASIDAACRRNLWVAAPIIDIKAV